MLQSKDQRVQSVNALYIILFQSFLITMAISLNCPLLFPCVCESPLLKNKDNKSTLVCFALCGSIANVARWLYIT